MNWWTWTCRQPVVKTHQWMWCVSLHVRLMKAKAWRCDWRLAAAPRTLTHTPHGLHFWNIKDSIEFSVSPVLSCCFSLRCAGGNIVLLIQAFRKKFIIPEFDVFARKIDAIYNRVENQSDGKVAVCHLFLGNGNVVVVSPGMHFDRKSTWSESCLWLFLTPSPTKSFSAALPSLLTHIPKSPPVSPCWPGFRLQTTSPSWPSSTQSCGECLCAQWMVRGKNYSSSGALYRITQSWFFPRCQWTVCV